MSLWFDLAQLSHVEQASTGHQLGLKTARSRVAELTSQLKSTEDELNRLRNDNDILSDRINDLQNQVRLSDWKNNTVLALFSFTLSVCHQTKLLFAEL